ncbi:lysophospholipid acyltransferase family protein [Novosphingobium sp. 9]|uniref:lysophospholipid acyltransferase family protein n=1 Tax=Novosphingobium sp. 9 TaxID=2025349 RepID=UPI0021B4D8E3|nr:lysophospholipid acyltransferase family protein [Novosphingobium sp. 9]
MKDTAPAAVPWRGWPLVILRIAALGALLPLAVVAYYIATPLVRRNPVPRAFLASVGAICGLRIEVFGEEVSGPRVLLANHVSWLDILALARTSGAAFVAHDGLADFRPLRKLCEMNRTVFVARHERAGVAGQVAQIRSAIARNEALAIFPEGTTSEILLPFKSSLLSALEGDACAETAIQPVCLDYEGDLPKVAWTGTESGLRNALRILARWRPVRLTVHFLKPLEATQRSSRKTMAFTTQSAIAGTIARLR